jgi:hypothetical protein
MTRSRAAWVAAGVYLLIAIVMTWPLARGLGRDVASDLGDSLLNMWIIAWDAEQLKAILTGDISRITTFFDANIFYPAPLTLAYSEHLIAQAVQIFPVYLVSGNPILCYNLLLLSTFALCGLGTFLLVRELTGNAAAAFLAGLLFAFAPYRFAQASHLQVLSVHWMPFVLYGFRRYFDTGRRLALAGAAAALVAQNLSCGYYLLYFAPLAGVYVLWEIATRGLWRSSRTWAHLAAAALAVFACTLPFLLPYKQLRDSLGFARHPAEIVRFSADVYSYFTASASNRAWGDMVREFPRVEGDLFPGFVPLALAVAAVAGVLGRAFIAARSSGAPGVSSSIPSKAAAVLFASIAIAHALLAILVLFTRRVGFDVLLVEIRATNITRLIAITLVTGTASVLLSRRGRTAALGLFRQPEAIFLLLAALAWWLSLGPSPRAYGRSLDLWSPYAFLLEHVPGYEGLRVPARLAMVVTFALAVLGGLGAARLPRHRWIATTILSLLFLLESQVLPFPVNGVSPLPEFATPEARVYRPARAPRIYQDVAPAPPDSVLLELPFGEPDYDARAVYYSTVHWKKLVNGYSGFFPPHYGRLTAILNAIARDDDIAWQALEEIGVTHVIVHEGAYLDDSGARLSAWLTAHGAAEVSRRDRDVLFEMPH